MKTFLLLSFVFVFHPILAQTAAPDRLGQIKVKILDERASPMIGVKVGYGPGAKTTDENGIVEFTQNFPGSMNGVGCELSGYYRSNKPIDFTHLVGGKWQPWPLEATLIMRKIEAPQPMYAVEKYDIEMPFIGSVGFDLEKLDWVQPFGEGVHSDFIFTLKRKGSEEKGEATLKWTFSNPGDGVFPLYEYLPGGSELKMPKLAPESGYLPEREWTWAWANGMTPENTKLRKGYYEVLRRKQAESPPPLCYFFRIRTVLDDQGKVVKAMYGKLDCWKAVSQMEGRGDLEWHPYDQTRTSKIKLTYYLNPDGTRRMEFDMEKNLHKNLSSEFEPSFP